jgi:hypothetical protein
MGGQQAPLQNRDTYQRQTGLLQPQTGTRPLTPRPNMDAGALRATTEGVIGKARKSLTNLEPRIELLMRSCQAAKLPMPGVDFQGFKHPLSPKGEQIIAYLQTVYQGNPPMAKNVQVVVFRYHDAGKVVERAQSAIDTESMEPQLLEELKLKCFYLARFHEEFKGDRVLSQLFPPPQTMPGKAPGAPGQPAAPMSTVERLKLKQAREAVLHKAEILAANLAPKMEILRLALEMLDSGKAAMNVGALFTPETRQARFVAMGVASDKALVGQLREVFKLYGQLQDKLKEARRGGEIDELKETVYPLGRLALTFKKHPILKDIFPLGEDMQFPEEDEDD